MHNQERQEIDAGNRHLQHSPRTSPTSSASMRTKAPRKVNSMKRSADVAMAHPPPKTRRLHGGSKSHPDLSGQTVLDELVRDKNAVDNRRAVDVEGYHGSSDSHAQYREDRQHSFPNVFALKWYDSLQVESIDKKRFMIPHNVSMPGYFVVEDHFHNSLFSQGAESEEATLLYQVLAFVQNVSNELVCLLKAAEQTGSRAREENMALIWKKIRGVSEMLETRYDLLQFRRLGHNVQARLLQSYCVPQLGGSVLARTVFRQLRNGCNLENAVVLAEDACAKNTQNAQRYSKLHVQLGKDGSDDGDVVVHLQENGGDKCTASNLSMSKGVGNVSNVEDGKDCVLVHAEDSRKSRYQEAQMQSSLVNLHNGLGRFPAQSKPFRALAIPAASRVLVEQMQKDERDGDVVTPRRAEWKSLKVIAISDGIGQSGSTMMKALPRSQLRMQQEHSPKQLGVEHGHDKVNDAKHRALPSPRKQSVLVNAPNGVEAECVSTLLTLGKTIVFTCVLGEEQRRLYRYAVVCPSWGGFSWSLLIFPNGDRKENVLAVFLKCFGRENGEQSVRWKAEAKFGICVAKRSSAIYASALDGGRNATVVNSACNEVLEMLPSVDGRRSKRLDEPYFGTTQHVFHSKCNNRGFPQLAPSSELRTPKFSNDEKKIVLFAFISEVQDVGQK